MRDPTERFSERVDAYVAHRPGYPDALLDSLLETTGIGAGAFVADIGAGSGIFTRRLLARGLQVFAVEPNADMRGAAEAALGDEPGFTSVAGRAESTGLADASVELVTAAQAFHWFANDAARVEFGRILEPGGRLALIWNRRDLADSFQRAYDRLLRDFAVDYSANSHMRLAAVDLERFFAAGCMREFRFGHAQRLDFAGIVGRLRSASYCPPESSPEYRDLIVAIERLFERHADGNNLDFVYETRLYVGEIAR